MNEREYNAISSAKEARKALVKDKIITEDKRLLCIDDLVRIISYFGGKLNDSLGEEGYVIKPSDKDLRFFVKQLRHLILSFDVIHFL